MPPQPFDHYYEAMLGLIHKRLVEKLDPRRVSPLKGDILRHEIRLVIERLVDQEGPLMTLMERERLILDVLKRTLGPEPAPPSKAEAGRD
jgi:hypothetical protein